MVKVKLSRKVQVKLPAFATKMVMRKGLQLMGDTGKKSKWQRGYKKRNASMSLQKDVVNKRKFPKG